VFQLKRAGETPKMEVLASTGFKNASEKVASFLKTAGTPVVDYVHPTLNPVGPSAA
jgi:hypothetical protein